MPATVTVPKPIGHDGVIYTGTYAGFLGAQHDPMELQVAGRGEGPAAAQSRSASTAWTPPGCKPASDC